MNFNSLAHVTYIFHMRALAHLDNIQETLNW